ncbi:MAG TPA: hypothetical protein VL485_25860 [Ktedonobacteraceae bacterium]|jgi:hypothetical protein|nr:hypothetical protein [Ktedonobacteraceae bacterium]
MFWQRFSQLSLVLFCFLWAPLFSQNVSAHPLLPRHSEHHATNTKISPHTGDSNPIAGASIQAANNIWYTGSGLDSSNYLLIRRWNGTTFADPLHRTPYQPNEGGQAVLSLSPTQTWLIANGMTAQNPLQILRFNGFSWTTYPSPPLHGEAVNAMAAINANDIWAVGSSGPLTNTFTMHWNGSNWQHITSPNVANKYNSLWGISARATNDVWAVGSQQNINGGDTPLMMHWDGKTWTITPSPPIASLPAHALNAVTMLSQNDVWTVGLGGLIEHWNGTRWQIVSSPIPIPSFLSLNALSTLTANDIWAVGQTINCPSGSSCLSMTYTRHWNGHTWQTVPSPSLSVPGLGTSSLLLDVHMFATNNVWAIGTGNDYVFFERWNGQVWQITTSHNVYF